MTRGSHRAHPSITKKLVSTVNVHDAHPTTKIQALHRAAAWPDEASVRELVARGANVNALAINSIFSNGGIEETPLHVAVRRGLANMVKLLLALGADPNLRANNPLFQKINIRELGMTEPLTPFQLAVDLGNKAVIQAFLDQTQALDPNVPERSPEEWLYYGKNPDLGAEINRVISRNRFQAQGTPFSCFAYDSKLVPTLENAFNWYLTNREAYPRST